MYTIFENFLWEEIMKTVYTYYKERLIEISGKNRSLFIKNFNKKNGYDIGKILYEDKEKAVSMANYMKNQFDFYGIATPERKELYKEFIKLEKKSKKIDWNFLDCCYIDNHRELQYLVYDYLLALKQF